MDSKILYHYSGNIKCFNILSNRSIRLSDIRKSNDYAEMQIFYPDILDAVRNEYQKNSFDFEYEDKKGLADYTILKDKLDKARNEAEIAKREGKLERAGELQYSIIPELEKQIASSEQKEEK